MATYVCTIGGTTRLLQQGWTIRETANGRAIFNGAVYSADASVRPAIGSELLITEDGVRIYGGNLDTPSEAGAGGFGKIPIVTRISAVDFNALADRRHVISGGFLAGTTLISALTAILGYLPGCTLDAAQVTGPALPLLQYDVRTITSILDELSVVTNYLWRIDYDKKLRMWLAGALTAPVSVTTANRFAEGDVTVEPSRKDYANRIIIQAGTGTSEVTSSYVSDGITTVLPLTYKLSTHRGYVTNQGVNETLGAGATWTYQSNTYPVLDTITRSSAPVGGNAISITYIAQFPYVTQSNDTGEQAANGIWEKVIVYPDVFDSTLAQNLASGQLLRSLVTSKTVKYITRQAGIKPGQTQTITVAERNISGTHLITDVETRSLPTKIPTVQRTVTAVGGTQYPGSWRDAFKSSFGTSSGTTVGGTILITEGGGGGSAGSGTTGTLAKWTAATTLGDSSFTESGGAFTSGATGAGFTIALSASTVTGTLQDARLTANVPLKDNSLNTFTGSMTVEDTFTTELIVSPGGTTGTFWPGLMGLNAGSGAATPLNLLLQPTGDLITDPQGRDILPALNYTTNIGMLSKKYLTLHAAELWVETLVAQNTIATIGGRVLVAPTNILAVDLTDANTTITVKYNNFFNGDFVYMEANGFVEWMRVTSTAGGIAGAYTYTVTRNLDGSGANQWYAGDALLNTGTTGNGFIDLYSIAGVMSGAGPTIVGNVRTGTTYNNIATRWAIGNLNGLYGYSGSTYGASFGDPNTANISIDADNGFRIRYGTTTKLQADVAGNLFLVGELEIGTNGALRSGATGYMTGNGYWLDYNAGAPRVRVGIPTGNRMAWDGTNLELVSSTVSMNSSGMSIATPTTYAALYSYKFTPGTIAGSEWGVFAKQSNAVDRYIGIQNVATSLQKDVWIELTAEALNLVSVSVTSSIVLRASGVTGAQSITMSASNVDVFAGTTTMSGDLTVGGALTSLATGYVELNERSTVPVEIPLSGSQWFAYPKADKLVLQFNHAGTMRYFYLDGTVGSGTWTHTTTAP